MRYYYDLHIHSALSPCGDEDMTPNNIVNMSIIKGLDMIAVTDHNSCGNVRATIQAAEGRIKVIPGMELTTSEEVHVLCYFPTVEAAEDMSRFVRAGMTDVKNQPEIFGHQYFMDNEDNITGEEDVLLVGASGLDIYEAAEETRKRGGIFVPAHIDRSSYSVLANLGFFPPDLLVDGVEITTKGLERLKNDYSQYEILTSSDAHYLEDIAEKERFLETDDKIVKKITKFLCNI